MDTNVGPRHPESEKEKAKMTCKDAVFCTFAVTGERPYFQAIYICRACCSLPSSAGDRNTCDNDEDQQQQKAEQQPQHVCICQACAQTCHNHDDFRPAKNEDDSDNAGRSSADDKAQKAAECVEYIGMGPSYCDCPSNKAHPCRIAHASQQEAKRLNIQPGQVLDLGSAASSTNTSETTQEGVQKQQSSCIDFVRDVFTIPSLQQDEGLVRLLRRQAETLVNHSKETFWINYHQSRRDVDGSNDENEDDGDTSPSPDCCALESLAWAVAQNSMQHYSGQRQAVVTHETLHGMEWWVQVKQVHETSNDNNLSISLPQLQSDASTSGKSALDIPVIDLLQGCTDQQELEQGIELHYDKDEAMAESFGLGVFPALSTVTYLCEPEDAIAGTSASTTTPRVPPTLIFSHCYDSTYNGSANEGDDDNDNNNNMMDIPDMVVSHAAPGKHLAFDGRLLHGAPAHPALRAASATASEDSKSNTVKKTSSTTRITFLVNLWTHGYKPAGVKKLPDNVRRSLLELEEQEEVLQDSLSGAAAAGESSFLAASRAPGENACLWNKDSPWQHQQIATINLKDETTDLPLELCGRIELPFVGNNNGLQTTDDQQQEEEEEDRMVLVTFPPPPSTHSTTRIKFGPGMQAYLDHPAFADPGADPLQEANSSSLHLPPSLAQLYDGSEREAPFPTSTAPATGTSERAFL